MNILRNALVGLIVLILHGVPAEAAPVEINVDPGSYRGLWQVDGVTGFISGTLGIQAVSLEPGAHQLSVASGLGAINFTVAANGDITSSNTAAATGFGNTLTFNTTTINVDPGSLIDWFVVNVTSTTAGPVSVGDYIPDKAISDSHMKDTGGHHATHRPDLHRPRQGPRAS